MNLEQKSQDCDFEKKIQDEWERKKEYAFREKCIIKLHRIVQF